MTALNAPGLAILGDRDHARPASVRADGHLVGTVPILLDWTDLHAIVLVTGALLTPGRRTVTAMLTVVGLSQAPTFTNYHRVLNRNRWSSARLLVVCSQH
jgi:hypothetical protein